MSFARSLQTHLPIPRTHAEVVFRGEIREDMSNIYVIIEDYIDIDGSTIYTYLGYVTTESEAQKCISDLNEKKRTWKNRAEASCTSYYYEEVEPYNANEL